MSKQPEILSAQSWSCPCGGVNGIPEFEVCATCGEWSLDGPVKAGKPEPVQAEPQVEAPTVETKPAPVEEDGGFTAKVS